MRDEIARYKAAEVQPLGINPAGAESHRKYAEKFGFGFPLLSDPEFEVAGAYGAVKPEGKGIQRSVVLVGKDGMVKFAARGAPGAELSLKGVIRKTRGE